MEEKTKNKNLNSITILFIIVITLAFIIGILLLINSKLEKDILIQKEKTTKSSYRLTSNNLENFDLKFLQLEYKNKNIIYSPLSIKYALFMLKDAANNNSYEQINNITGDYSFNKYQNSAYMSFANSMFIKDTYKDMIKDNYINTLKSKYDADIIYDSFQSPDNLNKWVSNKTFNLIDNLYSDISSFDYFLVNALAINMNWNNLIQAESGRTIPFMLYSVNYPHEDYKDIIYVLDQDNYDSMNFNGNSNTKSVKIGASINNYDIIGELTEEEIRKTVLSEYDKFVSNQTCGPDYDYSPLTSLYLDNYVKELASNYKRVDISTDFLMYDDSSVKAFAKDLKTYDDLTLQYVAIMPKDSNIETFINNITADSLNNIINNLKEINSSNFKDKVITKINGNIPLFKFDYELDLMNDLKSLGIEDVFDSTKANLSNMTTNNSYISSVKHKANIEFSNEGIKAAAATMAGGMGSADSCHFDYKFTVPVDEIDLSFDKPFIFLIRDKNTNEVWFVGSVNEGSLN